MAARRVLVTNWGLVDRGGSELYVRDVSLALHRLGQEPVVWSPHLGPVAEEIRRAGVRVVDNLDDPMPEPDVIHCQHHDETLAVLARFPDRPGMFVQHGAVPWQEEAPIHPRLLRYVAVDHLCKERLLASGVPTDRTTVIPNGVDLVRFAPRDALPQRPRRALALSNTAREDGSLPSVRQACDRMGISLDVAGLGVGVPMISPEQHLGAYDLVFAKARTALEALAVGCAVIVMDEPGIAGMVTAEELPEWRRWNLGRHLFTHPHDANLLCTEIARYDAADVARCREYVRAHCGLESMVEALVQQHDSVIDEWQTTDARPDHRAELRSMSGRLRLIGPLRNRDEALTRALGEASSQIANAYGQIADAHGQIAAATAERDAWRDEATALRVERDALRHRRAVRWVDLMASRRNGRAG